MTRKNVNVCKEVRIASDLVSVVLRHARNLKFFQYYLKEFLYVLYEKYWVIKAKLREA